MNVYIVGEDSATQEIIKRVITYCSKEINIIAELPSRGGKIKSDILKFNTLSKKYPVIMLTDLDANNCAPELLQKLLGSNLKSESFILNIAIDEAEAWLMADREGFAKYFHVHINQIPLAKKVKFRGNNYRNEMIFDYKSSLYMVKKVIPNSTRDDIIKQLKPVKGSKKGPEYNSAIEPFIRSHWDIDNALGNSDSLNRMIKRIKNLIVTAQ
jgi:hypothetical protein